MKLSIVIPVFNKWNFTKSCLEDLFKLSDDHEIIIIDNGSTDETEKELKNNSRLIYLRNNINLGFAKACNAGYDNASAPNVLFLNNDIRVKSNHTSWTAPLIQYCSDALVGPTMGQLDGNLNFIQEANHPLSGNSYLSGWCIAASKDVWNKLEIERDPLVFYDRTPSPQIFSEEFGLAYFEDTDLGFRAKQQNITTMVVDIPVVHFGKQTSKQLNTHQLYSQAREIFVKKWSSKSK